MFAEKSFQKKHLTGAVEVVSELSGAVAPHFLTWEGGWREGYGRFGGRLTGGLTSPAWLMLRDGCLYQPGTGCDLGCVLGCDLGCVLGCAL